MKKVFLGIIAAATLASCGSNNEGAAANENGVVISANFTNVTEIIVNRMEPQEVVALDTVASENGQFEISFDADAPQFYTLYLNDDMRLTMYAEPGDVVKLEGTLEGQDMEYTVEGSQPSNDLKMLSDLSADAMDLVQELNEKIGAAQQQENFEEVREAAIAQYDSLLTSTQAQLEEFIKNNPENLVTIFALYHQIAGQPVFTIDDNFELYASASESLTAAHPDNKHAKYLAEEVESKKAVSIGAIAPDFTMMTPEGEEVSVSDYRGNYVLVDFWAAWCKPCRQENPNVVAAYEKYNPQGFEVLGVSLDGLPNQNDPKAEWLMAIENDGLTWTQISDLKGWQTAARPLYMFNSIPHSVLLDPEGKIVAKNLRGEKLQEKLAEIYGG
jgi:peroxiredoxin